MSRLTISLLFLRPPAVPSQGDYLIDWDEIGEESVGYLVDMVQIDISKLRFLRNIVMEIGAAQ